MIQMLYDILKDSVNANNVNTLRLSLKKLKVVDLI